MGTHGRNAITYNGVHKCNEQSKGGHDARHDFDLFMFAELEPDNPDIITTPSMEDQTNECKQFNNFAHIDYDRKIYYTGSPNPQMYLNNQSKLERENDNDNSRNYEEIHRYRVWCESVEDLKRFGWTILFNISSYPKEYECENSCNGNESIREFIDKEMNDEDNKIIS